MSATTTTNFTLCVPRPSSGLDPNVPEIARAEALAGLPSNHVLVKVDKFGFSANNITYQALGEHPHFRYFDFNPAPTAGSVSPTTHGLIPVWGFGTVVDSTHPKIHAGERVYGYFAPTRYLLLPVSPSDVNKHAFYVPRPHLPADRRPYNQILRCAADPQYTPTPLAEDLTMLYRPLFWTSYWCEDWLFSSRYRSGASTILISSASAKTAFCLAYLVRGRRARGEIGGSTKIVGLTSKRNLAFTGGLGMYDEVLEYGSFTGGAGFGGPRQGKRWIYVDVAGNEDVNARVHAYFASPYAPELVACVSLGVTNLSPSAGSAALGWSTNTFDTGSSPSPSGSGSSSIFPPAIEHFFMPEWLNVRKHQLSITDIFQQQNQAWAALMRDCVGWVTLDRVYGAEAVRKAYEKVTGEGLGPEKGLVWSLWDDGEKVKARL